MKFETHSMFDRGAWNSRFTRSRGQGAAGSLSVARTGLPRTAPRKPIRRISGATVQRATVIPSRCNCRQTLRTPFTLDGLRFPTAEQYMMWRKARLFGDEASAGKILAPPEPGLAKQFGRQIQGFDSQIWDARKREIVAAGSCAKYAQNSGLKRRLLNTAPALLVEASPFDTVWGVGLAAEDLRIQDRAQWLGANLLGVILTETRARLAREGAA